MSQPPKAAAKPKWAPVDLFFLIISVGGTLMAALSVAKLLHSAFAIPLSELFVTVFGYYRTLTTILFGWIPELLAGPIALARAWLHIDMPLQEHWLDVFVIQNLHWGVACRLTRSPTALAFNIAMGVLLSLVSALACGLIDTGGVSGEFAFAATGILGMLLFTLSRSVWGAFANPPHGAQTKLGQLWINFRDKRDMLIGAAVLIGAAPLGRFLAPRSGFEFGMFALLAYFVFVAAYWFSQGYLKAMIVVPGPGTRWERTLSSRNGNSMYAFYMGAAFLAGLALIAMNAGLSMLGL